MKTSLQILLGIFLITLLTYTNVFSQGCVAIRSTGGLCTMDEHPDSLAPQGSWLFNANTRYYRSFRHFIGKQEQTQRIAQGTNVINHAFTEDLSLTRNFDNRWSVALDIPIISNSRSSLYEHGGKERHNTYASGVGDITVVGYAWLLNPAKAHKGNIQLGLGIKFPTGNDGAESYFYNVGPNGSKRLGPVDQSIQPGDGGTGLITNINAFYNLTHRFGFYGTFFYLMNPQNVNGVSTARGGIASANSILLTSDVMSIPDQIMSRAGVSYGFNHFDFSAGARYECLPVHDLVGGSDGFRRPGWIFSAEPGVNYRLKKLSIYAVVPIAIIRDRTQSVADIRQTENTGVYTHGDAAFADYVINVGLSLRF
ncbi:MAG TPA: hypothetical protein VGN20_16195 [Mucilaginibacter sp.]|jgi:hypothetical protein